MNKVKYYPKIEVQFGQHHMSLLKEKVLQETSPCFHHDHFRVSCMSIGLASAPMSTPSYMSKEYNKLIVNPILIHFDYNLV